MIAEKVIKAELLTAGHFLLSSAPVLHTNDSKTVIIEDFF